jgi:hypothetical protein
MASSSHREAAGSPARARLNEAEALGGDMTILTE